MLSILSFRYAVEIIWSHQKIKCKSGNTLFDPDERSNCQQISETPPLAVVVVECVVQ